jgi:hypothetical protein
MAFQPLSTSNTFTHWITETQRAVSVVNQFTDGVVDPTNYSNTNINVGEDLRVGGNLTVRGLITLDNVGYNDLNVSGNVNVVQSLTTTSGVFANLTILNNIVSLNASTLDVQTNVNLNRLNVEETFTTGNLIINGNVTGTSNLFVPNLVITQNVQFLNETSNLFVGTDVKVYGDLFGQLLDESGASVVGNLSVDNANIDEANITRLIGTANTNIYNNIFASNAYTSVQNTLAEFASLACILG